MPPSADRATPVTNREVEWKLTSTERLGVDGIRSLLTDVTVGSGTSFTLTATYYDTADLRLARRGITLRRRTGGNDDGWHLKLPNRTHDGEALDRDEVSLPLDHSTDPPHELSSLVTAYARTQPIAAIGVLRTHRSVHPLVTTGGAVIGEICRDEVRADIVSTGAHAAPTIVFHEWEVEARNDAVDEVEALVDALLEHGFEHSASTSKLRRALGEAAQVPDALVHDETPSRRRSARDDITYYLKEQVESLLLEDHRVRLNLPDGVHNSRVAARRLRSALRTFAPLLDSESLADVRGDLVWAADLMGRQRDLEVIGERLQDALDGVSGGSGDADGVGAADEAAVDRARILITTDLAQRQQAAHKLIVESMESPRWAAMLERLVAVAHDPPTTRRAEKSASRVLTPLASKQWKVLAARAKHLVPATPTESWHHTRISAKRARYAAEACAPAMGREPARFARALGDVTDLLGDLHDTDVSRSYLLELMDADAGTEGADPDVAFVLGQVYAAEGLAAERLRASFPHVWDRAARPRLRRWLRG